MTTAAATTEIPISTKTVSTTVAQAITSDSTLIPTLTTNIATKHSTTAATTSSAEIFTWKISAFVESTLENRRRHRDG